MKRISLLLALVVAASQSSGAIVIDFESLSHNDPADPVIVPQHAEDGYTVRSRNAAMGFGVWGTPNAHFAGSTGMFNLDAARTILTKDEGGTFDLLSIDLLYWPQETGPRL